MNEFRHGTNTDKNKLSIPGYNCDICGKVFKHKQHLYRHKKTAHSTEIFDCHTCSAQFNRKDNYKCLMKKHEHVTVQTGDGISHNINNTANIDSCNFRALNGTVETHVILAEWVSKFDPVTFSMIKYDDLKEVTKKAIKERGAIKWYLSMTIKMSRRKGDETETADPHYRGKRQTGLKFEDIYKGLKESIKNMYTSCIESQRHGSNWTIDKVVKLTMHMARYRPQKGSSYIPLPIKLRSKHAIINIKNKDNICGQS